MRSGSADEESALAQSLAEEQQREQVRGPERRPLEARLYSLEPGAALDTSTLEDGHCLMHALLSGGLSPDAMRTHGLIPGDLRQLAVMEAGAEQLARNRNRDLLMLGLK